MGAGAEAGAAAGQRHPTAERRPGTLEDMCGTISHLRERAATLEVGVRVVEKRILGSTPAEDDRPDIAKVSEPCVVTRVNADAAAIGQHLTQIANSFERLNMELGSIGE